MRLTALMLAAVAAATLVQPAAAQTNTTAQGSSATSPTPQGPPPTVTPDGAAPAAPTPGSPSTAGSGMAGMAGMPGAASASFQPVVSNPAADIATVLQSSGQFTILLKVADATGLTQLLKTQPGITVLAPTDAAFQALPPAALDLKDQANLTKLQSLLAYHIINTKLPPIKGHSATAIQTGAPGKKVTLDGSGDSVKVNDATALQPQVAASNGVIIPIDKVLSPDYVAPPAPAADAAAATTEQTTTTTTSKKKKRTH